VSAAAGPRQNHLLAALPDATFASLAEGFVAVPMRLGEMIHEPGEALRHAWFPTTSVVSLYCVTASGASAETSGVGAEGMVGMALFMGGASTAGSAVVQTAGHGYRLERRLLLEAFAGAAAFRESLLRYTQALITQVAQTAACYRHHSVEQQLSRWLLTTRDRVPGEELVMTQELVANLLGVRRESITQAAGRLQALGYIRYRRGHISIIDAPGLRGCACECYGVVRAELDRLLPADASA
jgi:CRP-like cAMP-binding protein